MRRRQTSDKGVGSRVWEVEEPSVKKLLPPQAMRGIWLGLVRSYVTFAYNVVLYYKRKCVRVTEYNIRIRETGSKKRVGQRTKKSLMTHIPS
jgi:hypothetical protein